jgi:aminoglycoside phosphotransferase family enzyme/predicted kinase
MTESREAEQEEALRFLADTATYGLSEPVGRIDTAGAVVFLAGLDVYKVKRAVSFPFMDLSTLARRREACEAEIAVNRDNAPGIYLDALPIVRTPAGLKLGGEGEVVEWVCHMRRFDESATFDRTAERDGLSDGLIDRLAEAVRRAHARAPLRDGTRAAAELETTISQNDAAFAERPDLFPTRQAARLTREARLAFAVARPTLLRRGRDGYVRRGHGDLHLGNIALIGGEPVLFDAVEFSDAIASGDLLYDLAFLLMDLEERGLRRAANRLFNRYLALAPPEALAGLSALPFFMSLRAAIRAKVEAAKGDRLGGAGRERARALARGYFALALAFLRYVAPRLVGVGGLSGAGKSALAGGLAPRLGHAPGALWLRSDVERKAMFGVADTDRLAGDAYAPDVTREVYRRLDEKARRALGAGSAVLLDATFSTARERVAAARVAAEVGVAFDGLFLQAPLAVRLARVESRGADASDADRDVAERQRAEPLGERGWTAIDASGGLETTLARAAGRLGLGVGAAERPNPAKS